MLGIGKDASSGRAAEITPAILAAILTSDPAFGRSTFIGYGYLKQLFEPSIARPDMRIGRLDALSMREDRGGHTPRYGREGPPRPNLAQIRVKPGVGGDASGGGGQGQEAVASAYG